MAMCEYLNYFVKSSNRNCRDRRFCLITVKKNQKFSPISRELYIPLSSKDLNHMISEYFHFYLQFFCPNSAYFSTKNAPKLHHQLKDGLTDRFSLLKIRCQHNYVNIFPLKNIVNCISRKLLHVEKVAVFVFCRSWQVP